MIKQFFRNRLKSTERGSIIVLVLLLSIVFTVTGFSLARFAVSQYSLTTKNVSAANATLVAEAGIEQALHELNLDDSFAGHTSEQVFFNSATQGRAVYTTTVVNSGNTRVITATGKAFRYNNTTNPISTRLVKVTAVGTASEGYSVHSGPGGLILGGSATITNADVYVNGYISMSGSARIGTNSQPEIVNVANIRCPLGASPGSTYAQLCTGGTGGQPIAISGSARIYGTVCATGQTSSTGIFPGTGGAGLQLGCTAPATGFPYYDRAAHLAAVTTTAASNNPAYTCSGSQTKTWPANLRLTGNVSLGGSCRLTITGNVHITGNFTVGGSTRITVANSVGTTRPAILVDGTITVGGSTQTIANNQGTGIHFISSKATASCNPDCTSLSGNDLKNSQDVLTVDVGGSGNLPGMIFQAQWGRARLAGSGNVGALAGQTVDMSGSGTVVFGTILSSGARTWAITSYQQVFP